MRLTLAVIAGLSLGGPAMASPAEEIADQLLPLMEGQGARLDRAIAIAALDRQLAALASEPVLAQNLPAALEQMARLAREAESPATRGLMSDLTREALWTAADMAGDAAADPIVAAWQKADPLMHETSGGTGLARSDVEAIARLRHLAGKPEGDVAADVEAEWQRLSAEPVNLVVPARFNAWADGAAATWDSLSEDERRIAAGVLEQGEAPSGALLKKVIGTDDLIHWLAAVDVPMTEDERKASPELLALMDRMAFAGPLQEPLLEVAAVGAAITSSALASNGPAMQLMRLNNWLSWTGDFSSARATGYMNGW